LNKEKDDIEEFFDHDSNLKIFVLGTLNFKCFSQIHAKKELDFSGLTPGRNA
jgi:hypothetical protein